MNNGTVKVKPSELGLGKVSYKAILNGGMSKFPMMLQQQAMLKAYHEVCLEEGKNDFISVSTDVIVKKLKKTPIKDFLPAGDDVAPDVQVLVNRGWFDLKGNNHVVLTDYAKKMIIEHLSWT